MWGAPQFSDDSSDSSSSDSEDDVPFDFSTDSDSEDENHSDFLGRYVYKPRCPQGHPVSIVAERVGKRKFHVHAPR